MIRYRQLHRDDCSDPEFFDATDARWLPVRFPFRRRPRDIGALAVDALVTSPEVVPSSCAFSTPAEFEPFSPKLEESADCCIRADVDGFTRFGGSGGTGGTAFLGFRRGEVPG